MTNTSTMFFDFKSCCVNIPQRRICALMCFLGLLNAFAMRGCLSIAITEMVKNSQQQQRTDEKVDGACQYPDMDLPPSIVGNSSSVEQHVGSKGEYEWSEYTQGLILSSFYWGYIITHLPGGVIAEKYGGKHTLGVGVLITAIFTLLTPAAIYVGDSTGLIILRVLMGFGEGTTYPAINVLIAQWTPPEERSRTASFVYAAAMIGTIYSTTVSGWILQYSSMGWPLVFYVIGSISVVWFIIWTLVCFNSPRDHPFISEKEANFLRDRLNEHTHAVPPAVPWRHILASKPLWAAIIALVGFNWTILSLITDLPKYMSGVLRFSVANNGYFTSLAYLCMWIGGNTSPWLADYLISKKNISTTLVRKCGSVITLTISATFIVAAVYAECNRALAVGMFAIGMTTMGLAFPSIMVNPLDLSPTYAGTMMAMSNGLSALTGIVGPYIIGVIATEQTLEQWKLVFWIMFGVALVSNIIYLIFGSGEVQYWNDPEFVRKEIEEKERRKSGKRAI